MPAFFYDSSGTLERGTQWNSSSKRTMIRMIHPVVRSPIRPMARQVSRRDAKLERSDSAGPIWVVGDLAGTTREEGMTHLGPSIDGVPADDVSLLATR